MIVFLILIYAGWKGISVFKNFMEYQQIKDKLPKLQAFDINPRCTRFNFPDKTWLHRVNSSERALLMAEKYEGLELDVTFDTLKSSFDIGHPPTPSIGLTLDDYFRKIPSIKKHAFWLDFKNLREDNKLKALKNLLFIANKYGIKNRLIVESQNASSLNVFTNEGFYTSYYIPVFNLANISTLEIQNHYYEMVNVLKNTKVCALSAASSQLPFLEKYFPQYDKLIWHLDDRRGLSFYAANIWLRWKSKVKVVLLNENSKGFR